MFSTILYGDINYMNTNKDLYNDETIDFRLRKTISP